MNRTRIKICGLTRVQDIAAAVEAGADAVGFVCYAGSPRYVEIDALAELAGHVPAFVTPVLLFVNAERAEIERAIDRVPNALLQFHGDELLPECERYARPYVRAVRIDTGAALLDCERQFASANALFADAPAPGYGGGGRVFDWSLIPPSKARGKPLILAGGLSESNVADAIRRVRPFAVDVSSAVEQARGIKSAERMRGFVDAVRSADAELEHA